jgi:hypothetical protein
MVIASRHSLIKAQCGKTSTVTSHVSFAYALGLLVFARGELIEEKLSISH